MGLNNSPNIFQEKMTTSFDDLEFVWTYIDDLLITTKSDWQDHLDHLDIVFCHLNDAGLKVNAIKSFFGKDKLKIITHSGIQPVTTKVEAINNIAPPTTT